MIFGTLIAMAIGLYFGAPLLPLLVVAALLQGAVAFALTKNPVVIRVTAPVAMAAVGTFFMVPLLTEPADVSSLPFSIEWFTWATGAIAAIGLISSTYIGVMGGTGPGGPNTRVKGAHMRRGERVESAPGQEIGSATHGQSPARVRSTATSSGAEAKRASDDGDFTTSMVVGASTGNTMLGYVVGGSMAGALVGSTLHRESPSDDRSSSGVESSIRDTPSSSNSDSDLNSSDR